MQSVFSAPSRPAFRNLSVEIVRRGAALKTLCIIATPLQGLSKSSAIRQRTDARCYVINK